MNLDLFFIVWQLVTAACNHVLVGITPVLSQLVDFFLSLGWIRADLSTKLINYYTARNKQINTQPEIYKLIIQWVFFRLPSNLVYHYFEDRVMCINVI